MTDPIKAMRVSLPPRAHERHWSIKAGIVALSVTSVFGLAAGDILWMEHQAIQETDAIFNSVILPDEQKTALRKELLQGLQNCSNLEADSQAVCEDVKGQLVENELLPALLK